MEARWQRSQLSIREIQEAFPKDQNARLHHLANHGLPFGGRAGEGAGGDPGDRPCGEAFGELDSAKLRRRPGLA